MMEHFRLFLERLEWGQNGILYNFKLQFIHRKTMAS